MRATWLLALFIYPTCYVCTCYVPDAELGARDVALNKSLHPTPPVMFFPADRNWATPNVVGREQDRLGVGKGFEAGSRRVEGSVQIRAVHLVRDALRVIPACSPGPREPEV